MTWNCHVKRTSFRSGCKTTDFFGGRLDFLYTYVFLTSSCQPVTKNYYKREKVTVKSPGIDFSILKSVCTMGFVQWWFHHTYESESVVGHAAQLQPSVSQLSKPFSLSHKNSLSSKCAKNRAIAPSSSRQKVKTDHVPTLILAARSKRRTYWKRIIDDIHMASASTPVWKTYNNNNNNRIHDKNTPQTACLHENLHDEFRLSLYAWCVHIFIAGTEWPRTKLNSSRTILYVDI